MCTQLQCRKPATIFCHNIKFICLSEDKGYSSLSCLCVFPHDTYQNYHRPIPQLLHLYHVWPYIAQDKLGITPEKVFFAVCINVIVVVPVCGTVCTHGLSVKVMSYMTLINMAVLTYVLCWHNSSMLKEIYYAQNNASIMWKSLTSRQSFAQGCHMLENFQGNQEN